MPQNNKLSAVIITYNEEKNIETCIDSLLEVADEILVVDSFSTDKTEEICKSKNIRFIQNAFEGHIQQKNFAMNKASYRYVLSLDADEALNHTLKESILTEKENFTFDAYYFNRLTSYCGQWIKHCGWYPDKKLRIWDKTKGEWGGKNPHDKVMMEVNTSSKHLKGDLLHYSYHDIDEHIKQIQFFTSIGAKEAFARGKKSNILLIIAKPFFRFIRDYIIKGGFLDGYYGFVICANSAYANFLKYLKIYELSRGKLKP